MSREGNRGWFGVLFALMVPFSALAAGDNRDDIRLYTLYFNDGAVTSKPLFEGGIGFADFDGGRRREISLRGMTPISSRFELGGELFLRDERYDKGSVKEQSGLSDIRVVGRFHRKLYRVLDHLTIGGELTLPTGKEELGEQRLNLAGFVAARKRIDYQLIGVATAGLYLIDQDDNHKISLHSGAGLIYTVDERLALSGEFTFHTEEQFAVLVGGADILIPDKGRIRPSFSLGVADGAPDVAIYFGYSQSL
ncbi:MAG: hypothetical protein HQL48_06200 [Gammaproteobacteria bacterium]|nr:hypothetical protein [Gammaproteobacteria bacterium]